MIAAVLVDFVDFFADPNLDYEVDADRNFRSNAPVNCEREHV